MILVVDVGNTNIKMGIFDGGVLQKSFRTTSSADKTSDEYGITLAQLFEYNGLKFSDITGIIMSSVIPNLNYTLEHMFQDFFGRRPMIIGPGIKTGLKVKYDNAYELGSDRIAVSVAALQDYGGPLITMDFGTATSVNVLTADKEFLGGVILPGVKETAQSMQKSTARLPKFELAPQPEVVGTNTVANMQSGIFYGFIGMAEYIVKRIREATGLYDAKVIATGGLAEYLQKGTKIFEHIDRSLSLRGLYYIYRLNAKAGI